MHMLRIYPISFGTESRILMKVLPKIPGYELLTCLGGGMITSVYSARDCRNDSACAVKVLRPDWEDQPVAVKLLQREARACLAVRHPHLISLREAHVMTAPHYLVMDLLPGESLRRRLRRDYQVPMPTALWIARQTAEALAALHRKGFIHADVKPENIRLIDAGKVVLLDLGFAHRPGENASFQEKGYVLGTANYLAPELCGKEPTDEHRSDIFSLGVTLFEMLTGELPYPQGNQLETMRRHRSDDPKLLTDHLRDAPAGLTEIVDAMLSRKPEDRPRSDKLVQELIRYEIASLRLRRAA